MTYEIVLSYTTEGVNADLDCDDEDLFEDLQGDVIFQDLINQLMSRFRDKAEVHDKD